MVSASTLVRSANVRLGAIAVALAFLAIACSSPMELDVERTKEYTDGAVHPTRLSFLYYFGDSAYEAIITDTSMLNTIWIERGVRPYELTIPWFIFDLPDTVTSSAENSPFVRRLCFSVKRVPCDGQYRTAVNSYSWVEGEYWDSYGGKVPFRWLADNGGRQIRLAWTGIYSERLIKGSVQVVLTDPISPRYVTYRGHMTIEY